VFVIGRDYKSSLSFSPLSLRSIHLCDAGSRWHLRHWCAFRYVRTVCVCFLCACVRVHIVQLWVAAPPTGLGLTAAESVLATEPLAMSSSPNWQSSNVSALVSRCHRIDYRPGHRLFWVVGFVSISRKTVPQLGRDLFFSSHFHFVVYHSAIWRCTIQEAGAVLKERREHLTSVLCIMF
jgi:hypothetical protein